MTILAENLKQILINNEWFKNTQELEQYLPENFEELIKNKAIRPSNEDIFNAFIGLTPKDVKVLIIGQDPYPDLDRAHGLAFSFKMGQKPEDSLKNIFNKIKSDLNIENTNTNLASWQKQGVLLLNTALTFNPNEGTETGVKVWKKFIDKVLENLVDIKKQTNTPLVVMLWGGKANNLKCFKYKENDVYSLKDFSKIQILRSSHPSNNYGSCNKKIFKGEVYAFNDMDYKPFKSCNEFLNSQSLSPINWSTN